MLFVRQSKIINFSPKIMAFSIGAATPSFVDGLGSDAEFIWGSTQWEQQLSYKGPVFGSAADYAGLFHKKYGEWPNYHNAEASAASVILQMAIEKAGNLDREQVREALASLDTEIFAGPVRFDKTGKNIAKPMFAIQIQKGKRVIVAPEKIQESAPIYPTASWEKR
jgi:branched-chain amino acid transport system substrate-binding protein